MAQTLQPLTHDAAVEFEKLGVIGGFLVGLAVALFCVNEPLILSGLPDWVGVVALMGIVALSTRAGLGLSRRLGRAINQDQ
jgi:UPF0716 family protein affecting phage T7 exclusion